MVLFAFRITVYVLLSASNRRLFSIHRQIEPFFAKITMTTTKKTKTKTTTTTKIIENQKPDARAKNDKDFITLVILGL